MQKKVKTIFTVLGMSPYAKLHPKNKQMDRQTDKKANKQTNKQKKQQQQQQQQIASNK